MEKTQPRLYWLCFSRCVVESVATSPSSQPLLACLGTPPAGFGASLAMVVIVLATLFSALLTKRDANPTDFLRMLGSIGQKPCRRPTYFRTLQIGPNTGRYHIDVVFSQTSGRTLVTGTSAGLAGLDESTNGVFFIEH